MAVNLEEHGQEWRAELCRYCSFCSRLRWRGVGLWSAQKANFVQFYLPAWDLVPSVLLEILFPSWRVCLPELPFCSAVRNGAGRETGAKYEAEGFCSPLSLSPNASLSQLSADLLRMFFDCLYDEEVISEDAFYKWESSKDPAEQNGKGVALKSVTAFFTWLREAEEESEDN